MIRMVICDDSIPAAGKLEDILIGLQKPFNDVFDIEIFTSGEELISHLDEGNFYDIAFLDIEMGKANGIDVGYHIRRVHNNQDTAIIYVSNHDNYHIKLYPVKTTAFVKKPPTTEDVREAISLAFEHMNDCKSDFIYQFNGHTEKVLKSDIFYFESDGRYMTIVTRRFSDTFRMTIDVLLETIDDPAFVRTHRSYIANIRSVTTCSRTELFFPNTQSIPISARRSDEVRRALLKHMKQQN